MITITWTSYRTIFIVVLICVLVSPGIVLSSKDIEQPTLTYSDEDDDCPPWFVYNASLSRCVCSDKGESHVMCTEQGALLRLGSCMTYEEGNQTSVARCQYFVLHERNVTENRYIELPDNLTELNDHMCGPMNRKGLVCSECIDGFGPSLTSIGYQCANCTDAWYGVPLFLFLEFAPITVFYLTILLFRINLTSAPMTSFVFYCQLSVYTVTNADPESRSIMQLASTFGYTTITYLSSIYSIWNLDFFHYVIPPFCISPRLKIIHIVILSYFSAFYPLFLIGITYMCIRLHSHEWKPVVWVWTKAQKYLHKSNVRFNTKNTIIDVFATFFLLSYTKLMLMFTAFLGFAQIVSIDGSTSKTRLDIDPGVLYFSGEHIPFALIAIFVLIVPVLLSALLLTLYPIKAVRSLFLRCHCGGHFKAAVNIFVEKFHLSYRDSLDGGRDMRSFAGLYFLIRALGMWITAFLPPYAYGEVTWVVEAILFGGSSLLIATVRPYKKTYMNIIDALVLFNISLLAALLSMFYTSARSPNNTPFSPGLLLWTIVVVGSVPIVGFVIYVTVKLLRNKQIPDWLSIRNSCCTCRTVLLIYQNESAQQDTLGRLCDRELPDRILHPDEYCIDITTKTVCVSMEPDLCDDSNDSVY